jgi:hypothetical protein
VDEEWCNNNRKSFYWIFISTNYTILQLVYNKLIDEDVEGLVEQTNNNKLQIITLSDGSSVLLQPNSKLSYQKNLWVTKEVYLSGEGFFEISKKS